MSGSKPISFARLSRVSAMSSTIRIRIFSASAMTPLTNVVSRSDVVRAFRPLGNIQASRRCTRRLSRRRSHRNSRDATGQLERESDKGAQPERHAVRDPGLHDPTHSCARSSRRAEAPRRDEAKSDDSAQKSAIHRAVKEKPEAPHRADRHEVLAIARLQTAHCIERVGDKKTNDESADVIEETLREQLA